MFMTKLDSLPEIEERSPTLQARYYSPGPVEEYDSLPIPASNTENEDSDTNYPRDYISRGAAQPIQGDSVLISVLANGNNPELAIVVGQQPLATEGAEEREGDSEGEMIGGGNGTTNSAQLAKVAKAATKLTHNREDISGRTHHGRMSAEPRPRPRLDTKNNVSAGISLKSFRPQDNLANVNHGVLPSQEHQPGFVSYVTGRPTSSQHLSQMDEDDSIATSPALRQHAIPTSERSPMEILPKMQTTSPTMSSKSPGIQQSLPSLKSALGEVDLKDGPPHPTGQGIHRLSFSSSGALHSPPKDLNPIRPASYGQPPHSRTAGPYSASYPSTEPSPASTNSALSPREFRTTQGIRSMSPPSKFGPRQYQTNGLTPQSDVQTPISAGSTQPSMRTLSSDSSPGGDIPGDMERSLQASQLSSGSLITSGFKCDHPGCPAPPFQTQYLLNSHANVHSSNRPHYCPVKSCSRSIGGKGFKRKNEMIRHGLVHQSPGYICPFCPEREHKYPRPDNLQRHVRVHHTDKDKEDPKLREVLSQRPEGGSRGRRRRVNS